MDWIIRIRHDENQALKEIYQLFRNECISWLGNSYALDEDAAIDVFQTTVIILYDNVNTGKLKELTSNIKTYLFAIAKNQALLYKKYSSRNSEKEIPDNIAIYIEEENDHMVLEQDIKVANMSLEILGDPCKSLLQLYYYKEMSMEEITELLGYKNADSTKNQKFKCLKRLQKTFSEYKDKKVGYGK